MTAEAPWSVETPDGTMLVHEVGRDTDPPVIVFASAAGVTPGLLDVARRLCEAGFWALVPEPFHRRGPGVTFDAATQRDEMMAAVGELTDAEVVSDTGALLNMLPGVERFGAMGFCMGGRFVVRAMAAFPDRIVAGAALHPTALLQDAGDSPHLDLERIAGPLYLGFGRDDAIVPPEHWSAVDAQATEHGKTVRIEVHPGAGHGYMLPGPNHNEAAAEASWDGALDALETLRG